MLPQLLKSLLAFVFPGGLLFVIALGFLRPNGLPLWCQGPVTALPYVALTFGLVFGWYFSSTRMLFALISLAFADQALIAFPLQRDPTSINQTVFATTALLLPLNFLGFSIVNDQAEGRIRGIIRIVLLVMQPFIVAWLADPARQDLAVALQTFHIAGWHTEWTPMPPVALLAFLISGIMHVIRFAVRRDPMDAGGAWALAAVFLAYHCTQYGWHPTSFLSTAVLILFVCLVQSSYQRTYRDELTGIPGRLAYEEAIAQLGSSFALAVVGIDQLKSYAGSHGRPVVEQILRIIAPKVQSACQGGCVFRVSGEELTLLFPQRSAMEALVVLNQVRHVIESAALFLRGRQKVWEHVHGTKTPGLKDKALPVTASIGVAEKSAREEASLSLVIKSAYRALYEAKTAGGNAVKRGVTLELPRRSHGSTGRIVPSGEY